MDSLLQVDGLRFTYGRSGPAVDIPNIAFGGGVHHVVGLNGSGKSTLLRLLAGLVRPDAGVIAFEGTDVGTSQGRRRYLAASGYLWQGFQLRGGMSTRNYLAYRAWLHGAPLEAAHDAADDALVRAGLHEVADQRIGRLSGGTQRRVGIAAEAVHAPRVLLLDEPSSGLDYRARDLVHETLVGMLAQDALVITVAHEPDELARHDSIVHVMRGGNIVSSEGFRAGEMTASALRELTEGVRS